MMKRTSLLTTVFATAVCLTLVPGAVLAGNGKGKGHSGGDHSQATTHGSSQATANGGSAKGKGHKSTSVETDTLPAVEGVSASELKWLNSAHASPTALEHASPNSRVGKNAAYVSAVLGTRVAEANLADASQAVIDAQTALDAANAAAAQAQLDLAAAEAELQYAIDNGLDTTDATQNLADATQALTDATNAQNTAQSTFDTATLAEGDAQTAYDTAVLAEADALTTAEDGLVLSDAALAYYQSLLGL